MAVELCKVSLWLEALEPGKPLSFLDAHIKCGNSLLGTTPELVAAGIPDAAFEAISGDDKAVARGLEEAQREERDGQTRCSRPASRTRSARWPPRPAPSTSCPRTSLEGVAAKAARHEAYLALRRLPRARSRALDAWCAAFVVPKTPRGARGDHRDRALDWQRRRWGVAATRRVVERTAAEYAFFHWPLEFPAVFERGGFDVVLGNPPWERIKLQEQEFFAERKPGHRERPKRCRAEADDRRARRGGPGAAGCLPRGAPSVGGREPSPARLRAATRSPAWGHQHLCGLRRVDALGRRSPRVGRA